MTDSKLNYLLGEEHYKWTYTEDDYLSFITPNIIIDKIIDLAKEHFNGLNDKVLWDMFSGIGSDGLRFASHAGKVICSEIDKDRYNDLV